MLGSDKVLTPFCTSDFQFAYCCKPLWLAIRYIDPNLSELRLRKESRVCLYLLKDRWARVERAKFGRNLSIMKDWYTAVIHIPSYAASLYLLLWSSLNKISTGSEKDHDVLDNTLQLEFNSELITILLQGCIATILLKRNFLYIRD